MNLYLLFCNQNGRINLFAPFSTLEMAQYAGQVYVDEVGDKVRYTDEQRTLMWEEITHNRDIGNPEGNTRCWWSQNFLNTVVKVYYANQSNWEKLSIHEFEVDHFHPNWVGERTATLNQRLNVGKESSLLNWGAHLLEEKEDTDGT